MDTISIPIEAEQIEQDIDALARIIIAMYLHEHKKEADILNFSLDQPRHLP